MSNRVNRFFFLLLLFCATQVSAQNGWQLVDSVPVKGDYISSDELGFIYVTGGNQVSRYDAYGNLTGTYCKLADGPVTCTDASDPLKILLFYKDFGKIKFLDRTMSVQGDEIALAPLGFPSASLACVSYQNAFWIFDPSSVQLIRFSNTLQQDQSSGSISQLTGYEIRPVALAEINDAVYLNDPLHGLLVFDRYGAYIRCMPFLNVRWFTVKDEILIYLQENKLHSYNMQSKEDAVIDLPVQDAASVAWGNGNLFVMKNGILGIYSLKK